MDFLFEGGGPGSTFVLKTNFALALQHNLKNNEKIVKKLNFHDWYIYFYARINNYKWHIDNFSGLKYRQHEINQLGANIGLKTKLKRFLYILDTSFLSQIKYFFQLKTSIKLYDHCYHLNTGSYQSFHLQNLKNFLYLELKFPLKFLHSQTQNQGKL